MNQIERIMKMEEYLDEVSEGVKNLQQALEEYGRLTGKLKELDNYYSSGEWLSDFEDDEDGKLPSDLKRGVLSEDALFDLLNEAAEAERVMRSLSAEDLDYYPSEYRYEIGYANGILDLAGGFSRTISYSFAQAYGLKNDDIVSSMRGLSKTEFDERMLVKTEESLTERLRNWYGMDEPGTMIERELGAPEAIYDLDHEFVSRLSDADDSWVPFYSVDDGFVAVFDHYALLFVLGNNE